MIKVFGRVAKFSSSFINPGRIYLRFIMYFFIFIFFVSAVCTFQYLDVSILEHIWIVCLIQVCVLIYYIVKLKVYLPLSILGNCYCFGLRVIKLGV